MTEEVLRLCGLYVLWESTRQNGQEVFVKKTVLIPILMIPKMRVKVGDSEPDVEGVIGSTLYLKVFFSVHLRL